MSNLFFSRRKRQRGARIDKLIAQHRHPRPYVHASTAYATREAASCSFTAVTHRVYASCPLLGQAWRIQLDAEMGALEWKLCRNTEVFAQIGKFQ
jgi:hypothetical protein